jgi:hypothetical protein
MHMTIPEWRPHGKAYWELIRNIEAYFVHRKPECYNLYQPYSAEVKIVYSLYQFMTNNPLEDFPLVIALPNASAPRRARSVWQVPGT